MARSLAALAFAAQLLLAPARPLLVEVRFDLGALGPLLGYRGLGAALLGPLTVVSRVVVLRPLLPCPSWRRLPVLRAIEIRIARTMIAPTMMAMIAIVDISAPSVAEVSLSPNSSSSKLPV